METSGMLNI